MKIANAYIEITNICNLNCRSCYNRSGLPHKKQELSYTDFKSITSRLVNEYGCKRISISGGEPTLHSEFEAILNCVLHEVDSVAIVTNGTTANDYLIDTYRNNNQLSIQVSLDGSCDSINATTRGSGNFDKAVTYLRCLADGSTGTPLVKMVVSKNNINDIEAYYSLAVNLGCIPQYDFINSIGNASDSWSTLALTAKDKLYVLRTVDKLNKEYGVNAVLPYCTHSCPLDNPDTEHSVLIKSNGAVQPCQMLYDDKYCIGNMLTDTADNIEAGMKRIADIAAERKHTDYGCMRCPASSYCQKGCMALAEANEHDPLGDDGECGFRKLQLLGFDVIMKGERR